MGIFYFTIKIVVRTIYFMCIYSKAIGHVQNVLCNNQVSIVAGATVKC